MVHSGTFIVIIVVGRVESTEYTVFLNSRTRSDELLPYKKVNHILHYLNYSKAHQLLLRLSPYCRDKE